MRPIILLLLISLNLYSCKRNEVAVEPGALDSTFSEKHRPQLHFSPEENWMNDPNGLVYHNGEYHLFYQYYPEGTKWGPMHWGHAVSRDLVRWEHLPIALYPDSLGYIFSGSAVVDTNNTSGLGTSDNPPLVAIFTYHSDEKEKSGAIDYQNQGIAYSTDKGRTWEKYEGNPVLKNQGIKDFRDPKVFWHEGTKRWIMVLAVKDHIEIWASADLKSWNKQSDFGHDFGAHGGVWECPDLFLLPVDGEDNSKWVMLVSINPGGPNGGSATQFFIGEFDGKTFTPDTGKDNIKWIDYGPDNYAGVTYSNTDPARRIFLGWMSNWAYGEVVPTDKWRSAMTVARDLSLKRIDKEVFLASNVVPEFVKAGRVTKTFESVTIDKQFDASSNGAGDVSQSIITGTIDAKDFSIELLNNADQKLSIGYDQSAQRYFIDRSGSGKNDFSDKFTSQAFAPRVSKEQKINFTIIVDVASVEVFFDDGVSVMTAIFFPDEVLTNLSIKAKDPVTITNLTIKHVDSIW